VADVIAGIADAGMELYALLDRQSSMCGYDVTSRSRLQLRGSKLATSLVGILHLCDRVFEAECSLGQRKANFVLDKSAGIFKTWRQLDLTRVRALLLAGFFVPFQTRNHTINPAGKGEGTMS
jgi:hypothetical protein